jgi:heme/copper-type cytochrome/quinol oxidase subunit 3
MAVLPVRTRSHPAELGLALFLTSLAVLFGASLVAYLVVRLTGERLSSSATVSLPPVLWVGTALLLAASFALHRSVAAARAEKLARLRRWLLAAAGLALLFASLQAVAVVELIELHAVWLRRQMTLYGIVMVLVALHAAHVVGGLVALGWVVNGAFRNRYDHECCRGLRLCAVYWHFLDAVWLVMLATFWLTT